MPLVSANQISGSKLVTPSFVFYLVSVAGERPFRLDWN